MKNKIYEKYYNENKEKLIDRMKKYNKENRERLNEYMKEYRRNNKDKMKEGYIKYKEKNKDKINEYMKKYRKENKEKFKEGYKKYINNPINRDKLNEGYRIKYKGKQRLEAWKLKFQVFEHYGGKCSCCGESHFEFLSIDHINNNGNEHRKDIKKYGTHFYKWIIDNNYPNDLQVLCFNCNLSKGFYGYCSHDVDELKKNRRKYWEGEDIK